MSLKFKMLPRPTIIWPLFFLFLSPSEIFPRKGHYLLSLSSTIPSARPHSLPTLACLSQGVGVTRSWGGGEGRGAGEWLLHTQACGGLDRLGRHWLFGANPEAVTEL